MISDEKAAKLADRFTLPIQVVRNVLSGSVEEMRERYLYFAPSNGDLPELDYPKHDRYTVQMMNVSDPMDAYIDYIDVVDPCKVTPSEPENGIRLHPTFSRYVKWYLEGHMPPYPAVFEQILDGKRKLIGASRRRILAAQEAGIPALHVWLGRWNRETGLPLKYGDIIKATKEMH